LKHLELKKIVLIGASTGGPGQIQKIISALPRLHNTSVVVAQHMIDGFMDSFTARLQDMHDSNISVVSDNQLLESSNIYVIDGETKLNSIEHHLSFIKKQTPNHSYNPNINLLFNSFVPLCKDTNILCIILTGIGDDGVEACKNLRIAGARCVTESKESAIVDGMPNRAREEVPGIEVYQISQIVEIISEFCE